LFHAISVGLGFSRFQSVSFMWSVGTLHLLLALPTIHALCPVHKGKKQSQPLHELQREL